MVSVLHHFVLFTDHLRPRAVWCRLPLVCRRRPSCHPAIRTATSGGRPTWISTSTACRRRRHGRHRRRSGPWVTSTGPSSRPRRSASGCGRGPSSRRVRGPSSHRVRRRGFLRGHGTWSENRGTWSESGELRGHGCASENGSRRGIGTGNGHRVLPSLQSAGSYVRSTRCRPTCQWLFSNPSNFQIRRIPRSSCSCVRQRRSHLQLASCNPSSPAS